MQLGRGQGEFVLSDTGWPAAFQAEILRERYQLDMALSLAEEAVLQCKQNASIVSFLYLLCGYAVLLRVHLSRGEWGDAYSALQQIEHLGIDMMNRPCYI